MKNIGKFAVLSAVLAASSSSLAFGASITLGSFGSAGLGGYAPVVSVANSAVMYTGNQTFATDTTGCGVGIPYCLPALGALTPVAPITATDLNPVTVWAGPFANSSFVGINANAGPQATSNPQFGYYRFETTFSATPGVYIGTFDVYADDTTAVYLNGTLIPGFGFGALGSDAHCADNRPTCLINDLQNVSLTLNATNNLTFIVEQAGTGPVGGGGDPSGFDFVANLGQTPEPSSLMLLGSGLVGAAGMFFRRRVIA